ncbi:MAG TPA: penicillin-binding transpeptidase domain-containing protein, partial [Pseudogracilibacillus sp.]|nr:penicillin-binding transpeptidase domain-containing protein [Pseudogracilibacillus sp.]
EDALAVAMNPKTGEIIGLSAMHYDRQNNKYEAAPHKIFYDAHRPGSTVKGATVLAGLESGIITPGQVFVDRPIKIAQTPVKASYARLGAVNDIQALKVSSNVYMFYIGLRMGGEFRHPFPDNSGATYNREGAQKMRNYFHQFGLGVGTGVDFPFESTGFVGDAKIPGNLMDLGIGQYDTYTTLQLAQYVSTIANDGIRVEPHLVKEIRNPSTEDELGSIYKVNHPKVLNKIDVDPEYVKRVQTGFWKVFNEAGGTGYRYWAGKKYRPAGKTGTAENEVYEPDGEGSYRMVAKSENLALVGYAPFEDPEIAFAIIVPNLGNVRGQYPINHHIGTRLMDAYFKGKENKPSEDDET